MAWRADSRVATDQRPEGERIGGEENWVGDVEEGVRRSKRKAVGVGGSSEIAIHKLIDVWKNNA
ncbi:UDP-glycosyltransferase 708D1 [Senna tora]|uniref:UDP-glycosyltransferase 708D1 n=1 Tax=Senna tora TaxID=362788 RepID=A0A834WKF6_9FABA|nr:UDP-glycosyltransferase 708D1 [Senna tora]